MSARLSVTRQLDKKNAQIEIQIGRPKTGDSIILVPFDQLGMGYFGVLNTDLIFSNNLPHIGLSLI